MTFSVLAALMGVAVSAANEADIAAFREARFGMFIHWGLYSQLGGRWKGQKMDYIGEWIQSRYQIPNAEYAKLAKDFNPVKFDADEWARQAKDAGMEYVVFTTKHHEGFSMYATKVSDYNIVDATPFKRDAFGELAVACRRHGLKIGIYYSQALDWHEFDAADPGEREEGRRSSLANHGMPWGNSWDWPDATKKDFSRYLNAKVYPQLSELLTNYGELFTIWFDVPCQMSVEMSRDLKRHVRSLQPHVLVNSRIGNGLGDFGSLGDNQMIAGVSEIPVESPVTLNDTWGFKYDDQNWKNGYEMACALAQNIAHNANLLVNVGPRPDGRFPDASSDVLAELAAWRKRTGFVIRGAKASPFPQEMPWGWCTVVDGNTLQFVVRANWTNSLEVCGLRNRVRVCTAAYEQRGGVIRIDLPPPDDCMPRVVRLALEGELEVDREIMPQNGILNLTPSNGGRIFACGDGRIGKNAKCRVSERGALTDWHRPGDGVSWTVNFPEAGRYRVSLVTESWAHGRPWGGMRSVEVSVGDERLVAAVRKDRLLPSTVYEKVESRLGAVEIRTPGETRVSVATLEADAETRYVDLIAVQFVSEDQARQKPKKRR